MAKDGHPFFQNAIARNISSEGALLSGLEQQITPGDTIGVQYVDKKARFRVVWVIDAGAMQKIQAGIQMLDGQQCPWRHEVETAQAAPEVSLTPSNKRKFVRYKIRVPLEMRDQRGQLMQTNATDMNGRGCYVETLLPSPLATPLTITFWIESEKFSTAAVVRASDPGVGMGIEFIGLDEGRQQHLQTLIEKVASSLGLGSHTPGN